MDAGSFSRCPNPNLGRLAFGVGAVFLIVITLIGWWKYLRGRW